MPSGLVALLDDISVIAKVAASSLDDVGAAATKAGSKAAGVVIDDAAVTPSYVINFTPDRELPIIAKIAKGSLVNKAVILVGALLLSQFLPQAVTPLLMLGGLFLCFEGAEKLMEKFGAEKHGETLEDPIEDVAEFEKQRVSGAIRTDFILSAEIMVIALKEVADQPLIERAIILVIVGVAITILVYGAVAFIVKMDDIGLHLTKRASNSAQALGRLMLLAMPKLLTLLATVGTAAMLWVGGQIIVHGWHELGWHPVYNLIHGIEHTIHEATGPLGGLLGWLTNAALSAVVGVILGAMVAVVVHMIQKVRGKGGIDMAGGILFRLGGLLCLAIAAGFGWFFIWQPYQAALAHAPEVDFSTKAFVLVPFAAVFGVFFLLFGDSVPYRNVEKQTPTAAGWLLVLVAAVIGGAGFWWFNAKFDELGYAMPGQYPTHQELTPLPKFPVQDQPKTPG